VEPLYAKSKLSTVCTWTNFAAWIRAALAPARQLVIDQGLERRVDGGPLVGVVLPPGGQPGGGAPELELRELLIQRHQRSPSSGVSASATAASGGRSPSSNKAS